MFERDNGDLVREWILHDAGEVGSKVTVMYATDFDGDEVDIDESWEGIMDGSCEGVNCEEVEIDGEWSEGEDMAWATMEREGANVVVWRRTSIMKADAEVAEIVPVGGGSHENEVSELCLVG